MPTHRNVLIAIIDDDDSFREAMEGLIRSLGYEAVGYSSAEAFLDTPSDHKVDCVVSDIQMPGMSGIEMKQQLNNAGFEAPVIFVTAHTDRSLNQRVEDCGGILLLRKPFDAQVLVDGLGLALEHAPPAM